MKAYVKPELTALSLSGNEVLCGGCENSTYKLGADETLANTLLAAFDTDGDGDLSEEELKNTIYCKFTSTTGFTVMWS